MTAPLNLDPIKALCAAATPGPWGRDMAQDGEHRPDGTGYAGDWYETDTICEAPSEDNEGQCEHIADAYRSENAAFIARSRSIVDALVAEVERLRGICMSESRGQLAEAAALLGVMTALGLETEAAESPGWDEKDGTAPAYQWGRSRGDAKMAEAVWLRKETSAAFGEQMRAEGERDAARRELSEIRAALGDLVNAGGNKGLPETVAGLAEYAMRTSDRLIEVSDERDKLRVKWCDVETDRDRMRAANAILTGDNCRACWCCVPDYPLMMLCPDCGNKRCPRATNHRFVCTGSNALGQVGTLSESAPLPEKAKT